MGIFTKSNKLKEPEFYSSATNMQTLNYNVYYMKSKEKLFYFFIAFIVGVFVGYLFYGGIGKDEFGQPTTLTHTLDLLISCTVGIIAGIMFIPIRTNQIIAKRKKTLNSQFRDMLEAFTISLGAGKNVVDSFTAINEDLKIQYESDAYIIKELEIVISGIHNNVAVEDLLFDFGTRSSSDDIKSFANVFKISYRKGGNLKEIIRNTHEILSDKMEIREDLETIVTSNKTEQNIMVIMPIALIGVIKIMSPEFAGNFVKSTGIIATTIAIITFIIAFYVGRKILDIKL